MLSIAGSTTKKDTGKRLLAYLHTIAGAAYLHTLAGILYPEARHF